MTDTTTVEDLLRTLAPRVLAVLVRRHGQFDACEDAVQEALLAAAMQWPAEGVPAEPAGWLVTVAGRRLTDQWRSESARRRREAADALRQPYHELITPSPADELARHVDDTLTLLFLCCHPALSAPSQVALTLRAVGGLTTEQIARAFLVPETTMGQRISRAKKKIKDAGARFAMPAGAGAGRAAHGRAAGAVPDLQRGLHRDVRPGPAAGRADPRGDPADPRGAPAAARGRPGGGGRGPARADAADRLAARHPHRGRTARSCRWPSRTAAGGTPASIREGTELIEATMATAALGPYQLQAAIAAVHAEAPSTAEHRLGPDPGAVRDPRPARARTRW